MWAVIPEPDDSVGNAGSLPLATLTEFDEPDLCRINFLQLKLLKSSIRIFIAQASASD